MKSRRRRTVGMALVALVLLIASVFMLMTAGAGDSVTMGIQLASRTQFNRRTNYAAYGAMQMGLDKLSGNLTYSIDPPEVGNVTGDPELVYELSVYNNWDGSFPNPAPDGRYVPQYMAYIKAKSDFRAYPGRYTSTLFSKAYVGGLASNYAIVGTDRVDIEGASTVDAYWINGSDILKKSASGRISTNSIQPSGVVINGTSYVDCNLSWGPYGAEATVLNITAVPGLDPARTKTPGTIPVRVPRFHPPRNPGNITVDASKDRLFTGGVNTLTPGDYRSLTVQNCTLTLQVPTALPNPPNENKYYVANNVTIINSVVNLQNESGAVPCDLYVGKGFNAVNSTINWANALTQAEPPAVNVSVPDPNQEVKGPRTMRIFFVGSGAPKFKDCDFIADGCRMSLFATGKAMRAQLLNNSIMWGGFKGFRCRVVNSKLHYHRVY